MNQELENPYEKMKVEELVSEYQRLMTMKVTGQGRNQDLQTPLFQITQACKKRDINIYKELAKKKGDEKEKKEPEVKPLEMIKTPESGSIEEYGYDELTRTFYWKYKSGPTTYSLNNVPPEVIAKLKKADSKGTFIAKQIKAKYGRR